MNDTTACLPNNGPFTSNGYTLYSPEHHLDRPNMRWLIDGVLPETGLGCIYGAPGTGKSFLCLDIAARVGLGEDWFGRTTSYTSVLYIALEGKHGFYDRIKAWEAHNQIAMPACVRFVYDSFDITDGVSIGRLVTAIRECDEDTRLVIVDTLNRASPRADENSSRDMGEIIEGASVLQSHVDGLVLLVHHEGKDATRGLRGHSSLLGALDVALKVETVGNHYQWRIAKLKDGRDGIKHEFRLIETECSADEESTSLVVVPEGNSAIVDKTRKQLKKNQLAVLASVNVLLTGLKLNGLPARIAFDEAVKAIQSDLVDVDTKHRSTRTKEALQSLCKEDYLLLDNEQYLSLAQVDPEEG